MSKIYALANVKNTWKGRPSMYFRLPCKGLFRANLTRTSLAFHLLGLLRFSLVFLCFFLVFPRISGSDVLGRCSYDSSLTVQGSRKYMLGRPSHVFLTLAQACIFDIRRPMYYFSLIFPYKTLFFLYIYSSFLHFPIYSYYFPVCLASNIFGCPVQLLTNNTLCTARHLIKKSG